MAGMKQSDNVPDRCTDRVVSTVSSAGDVLVRAIVATQLVREATSRHAMSPTATTALGRALTGCVLLAAGVKEQETIQLQIRGDGPLGSLMAIADPQGRARGYVSNPAADPRLDDGTFDVPSALGRGLLTVSRRRPRWPAPQSGTVELETGEIAEDLARYLAHSEQVPSAIGLGISVTPDAEVEAAGGFLVQALPGADDDELARVEENVQALANLNQRVREGVSADELVDLLLAEMGSRARHSMQPHFYCPCSRRRALRTLSLLGDDELRTMADSREPQEVRCNVCGERYLFGSEEMHLLLPRQA